MKKSDLISKLEFEQLYYLFFPKLVRFSQEYVLAKEEAENIVQDVFLTIWEQRSLLDSIHNPQAFLFRLTKNKSIDFLRRKTMKADKNRSLQEVTTQELEANLFAIQQFDEEIFGRKDMDRIISEAIQNLPGKCREIFILSRMEGLSHQQIADQLQISPSTVNNQITQAIKRLKFLLKEVLLITIFVHIYIKHYLTKLF